MLFELRSMFILQIPFNAFIQYLIFTYPDKPIQFQYKLVSMMVLHSLKNITKEIPAIITAEGLKRDQTLKLLILSLTP